jgi:hypothetical protein
MQKEQSFILLAIKPSPLFARNLAVSPFALRQTTISRHESKGIRAGEEHYLIRVLESGGHGIFSDREIR